MTMHLPRPPRHARVSRRLAAVRTGLPTALACGVAAVVPVPHGHGPLLGALVPDLGGVAGRGHDASAADAAPSREAQRHREDRPVRRSGHRAAARVATRTPSPSPAPARARTTAPAPVRVVAQPDPSGRRPRPAPGPTAQAAASSEPGTGTVPPEPSVTDHTPRVHDDGGHDGAASSDREPSRTQAAAAVPQVPAAPEPARRADAGAGADQGRRTTEDRSEGVATRPGTSAADNASDRE
jgi:hypothetical protein